MKHFWIYWKQINYSNQAVLLWFNKWPFIKHLNCGIYANAEKIIKKKKSIGVTVEIDVFIRRTN